MDKTVTETPDGKNPVVEVLRDLLSRAESGNMSMLGYVSIDASGCASLGTALGAVSSNNIVTAVGGAQLLGDEFKTRLSELQMYLGEQRGE